MFYLGCIHVQRWISLIGGVALLFLLTGCLEGGEQSLSSSRVAVVKPSPEAVQTALDLVYVADEKVLAKKVEMEENVCESGPDDTASTLCSEQAMPYIRDLKKLKKECGNAVEAHNKLSRQLGSATVNTRTGSHLNPLTEAFVTCGQQ